VTDYGCCVWLGFGLKRFEFKRESKLIIGTPRFGSRMIRVSNV
jgi:hypothetical protein